MKLPVSPEAVAVVRERVHRSCAAAEAELAGASSGGLWQALATAADDLPDDGGLWGINIMFRAVILDAFEDTDSPLPIEVWRRLTHRCDYPRRLR